MAWPGSTDKMRGLFLKGFRLSNQGSFEDPTYLGFKIVIDFGNLPVDPEFGVPPSPLFRPNEYTFDSGFAALNPFGQEAYQVSSKGSPPFHSAQSYLREREGNGFPESGAKRSDILAQFSLSFRDMLENYPWFIQSIDGVDELVKVKRGGYVNDSSSDSFDPSRTKGKVLTFNCLESLNQRMTALGELYKQATFDPEYMRELVPRNLRKFKMFIFVTEIRQFFKTSRLIANSATLTTINNFSNLVSNALSNGDDGSVNDSFNSSSSIGGGFGPNVGRIARDLGVSDILSTFEDQSNQTGIKPILVIECSGCEFNFDDSTSIPSKLDNGSGTATEAQYAFKVHVQRVKTKYQFPNIRQDGKFLILGDGWGQQRSAAQKLSSDRINNDSALGDFLSGASDNPVIQQALGEAGDLLTNVAQGAINDVINEGIADFLQPALQGLDQTLLGNVYAGIPGASNSNPSGAVFNSAQQILDQTGFGNIINSLGSNSPNNPFSGDLPNSQTLGFGGPSQRVYPTPDGNKDAYANVPGSDLGVNLDSSISRVYPEPRKTDSYPNSPGRDLGVPGRIYPEPEGDFYTGSPGTDLGVPDRVYGPPGGDSDSYPSSPGESLGVPDRVYPEPDGDSYPFSPGADLGVPDRVYPGPEGDVYTKVPGSDLGLPDRAYEKIQSDVYSNVPGSDLGVPDRKYENFSERVYPENTGTSNSNISEKVYPEQTNSVGAPFSSRVYPQPETPEVSFEKNNRPQSQASVYVKPDPVRVSRGELGKTYPVTAEDFVVDKINEQTTLNLGNMKPSDKYNASLGQFNPDDTKFIED
jgi:hypothetical protein